jgi:hypothetical protein
LADPVAFTVTVTDTNGDYYSHPFTFAELGYSPSSPGPNDSYNVSTPGYIYPFEAPDPYGDPVADFTVDLNYNPGLHDTLNLNFSADADPVFDTTFQISSTAQGIGPITGGASLYFHGTLGGSDNYGSGEPLTGQLTNPAGPLVTNPASLAAYYGAGAAPTTLFASLIAGASDDPANFNYAYSASGDTGIVTVPGAIASMQTEWDVTVPAGAQASGTSDYEPQPVPEPSSLVLLALGSLPILALGRRLRRTRS